MMRPDHPFLVSGAAHPAAKLTDDARARIRLDHQMRVPAKLTAANLGVCVETIYRVRKA